MIQTPTTEIHLLKTSASIQNANTFQILIQHAKDKNKDASLIPAADLVVSIGNDDIATLSADLLLTALDVGETFVTIQYTTHKTYTLIIRVCVHTDIAKDVSNKYIVLAGDKRITTYKSITTGDDKHDIFYTPTVFAKFVDGVPFGDISLHPYLKFKEINANGSNISSPTDYFLDFEQFAGSNLFKGRFKSKEKGTDPVGTNYPLPIHRKINITLDVGTSGATSTKAEIGIRCEGPITEERKILRNLNRAKTNGPITRLLILGEGYGEGYGNNNSFENSNFKKDCEGIIKSLFKTPPYNILQDSIEIWCAPHSSAEKGVTLPGYLHVEEFTDPQPPNTTYNAAKKIIPWFNYYQYPAAIKAAVLDKSVGLYKGTNSSLSAAQAFYDANTALFTSGPTKSDFIDDWKKTKPNGMLENKDTRFSIVMGKRRLSERQVIDDEKIDSNNLNKYWFDATDYFEIGFDKRKSTVEVSDERQENSYLFKRYLKSLQPIENEPLSENGSTWQDNGMTNRTFVAFLINHPMYSGINMQSEQFFALTFGTNQQELCRLSPPQHDFLYSDDNQRPKKSGSEEYKADMSYIKTFIHEFTHCFNIGDEYEDDRGEGKVETRSSSEKANVDVFEAIKTDASSVTEINPYKVKWNWPRILLASTILNNTEDNKLKIISDTTDYIKVVLESKEEALKWKDIFSTTNNPPVYLRSLTLQPFPDPNKNADFLTIGDGYTGKLELLAAPTTTDNVLKLKFDITKRDRINKYLQDLGDYACIYTKYSGLYFIDSVTISNAGSGLKKKKKKLTLFIEDENKQDIKLNIETDDTGKCISAAIDSKDKNKFLFSKDPNRKIEWGRIADPKESKKFFEEPGSETKPEFTFTYKLYDSGKLGQIAISEMGSGYTNKPSVTIAAPIGGGTMATAEAVLTDKTEAFLQLDPSHKGGDFLYPIILEAVDKRPLKENRKGSGFKAIVTELDTSGGIKDFNILDYGNGLYSTTSTDTKIDIITNGKPYEHDSLTDKATLSFDADAYHYVFGIDEEKKLFVKFGKKKSPVSGSVLKYDLPIQLINGGSNYKMPIGPMKFVLQSRNNGALNFHALVLGYLSASGEVEKVEIINPGGDVFKVGDEITPIIAHNFEKGISEEAKSIYQLGGYYMGRLRRETRQYDKNIPGDDKEFLDELPVFEVLAIADANTSGEGKIKELGFAKDENGDPRKGTNLRYPTQPMTFLISENTSYYRALELGVYDIIPEKGTAKNSEKIKEIRLMKPNTLQTSNRKVRVVGGTVTVKTPTGTIDPDLNIAVPADTDANSGDGVKGAQVLLDSGKSVEYIKLTNHGKGYFEEPNVIIGAPNISGGVNAVARAGLDSSPGIMDKNILMHMNEQKKPLIDKILGAGDYNSDNYKKAGQQAIKERLNVLMNDTPSGNIYIDPAMDVNKLIAIFEGSNSRDLKAYRPSFDSLMRNSRDYDENVPGKFGLNYATMYYLVNFINPSKLDELDKLEFKKTVEYKIKK